MELDGGRIASPSDVKHLARVLCSGVFIRLYDGIAQEILAAISINGNKLTVMLSTELRGNLFKELLAYLGAFSYVAGSRTLGHMLASMAYMRCQCSVVYR
jgi:hypothetical protein